MRVRTDIGHGRGGGKERSGNARRVKRRVKKIVRARHLGLVWERIFYTLPTLPTDVDEENAGFDRKQKENLVGIRVSRI